MLIKTISILNKIAVPARSQIRYRDTGVIVIRVFGENDLLPDDVAAAPVVWSALQVMSSL